MKLAYDPSALAEIEDAANWYETKGGGLAHEFLAELTASIQRLLEYPNAWPLVGHRVR